MYATTEGPDVVSGPDGGFITVASDRDRGTVTVRHCDARGFPMVSLTMTADQAAWLARNLGAAGYV